MPKKKSFTAKWHKLCRNLQKSGIMTMAFEPNIQKAVETYVRAHIADEDWHQSYFDFVDDEPLAKRLAEEFHSTRYIYKLLEGLEATEWLLRAQVRNQILSYASIYEAVLHHILFTNLAENPVVIQLTEFQTKKAISIPGHKMAILEKALGHDGKKIIPTYEAIDRTDETKVRFDRKTKCAIDLGIIKQSLGDELIEFYEARNSIHIHAEIRKGLEYGIDLSKRCYRRLQPFRDQVVAWQSSYAGDGTCGI